MPYSTQADLEEQISLAELIQLTDDAESGNVDTSAIARGIADADAEIDGYCSTRYPVPFFPVPVMIRKLSVDIAIYNLFSRRALDVADERQERYNNAIRFLRDLAKGLISIGADAPAASNADQAATSSSEPRIFTRTTMKGF